MTISDLYQQTKQYIEHGRVTNYHRVSHPFIRDAFDYQEIQALLPIEGAEWEKELFSQLATLNQIQQVGELHHPAKVFLFGIFRRLKAGGSNEIRINQKALSKENRYRPHFQTVGLLEELEKCGLIDFEVHSSQKYYTIKNRSLMGLAEENRIDPKALDTVYMVDSETPNSK